VGVSNIEWTDKSWNPVVGCEKVSPGCARCYAERMAGRIAAAAKAAGRDSPYLKVVDRKGRWNGRAQLAGKELATPLRWKKPCRVFVCSMSDLFHEDVSWEFLDCVFAVMGLSARHTFQVLTKRPDRMRAYLSEAGLLPRLYNAAQAALDNVDGFAFHGRAWDTAHANTFRLRGPWPLPNVWLGVSVENNDHRWRIEELLQAPAGVRFLSYEPALGPLDLTEVGPVCWDVLRGWKPAHGEYPEGCNTERLSWVIAGCESGPGAHPMDLNWVRCVRDQCARAGVPFFLKQCLDERGRKVSLPLLDGARHDSYPES